MSTFVPPVRWFHVGPHGYYDLVRLARRGRTALVRVLYILALFVALATVYYNTPRAGPGGPPAAGVEESINHNARIAERFSKTILAAQNFAVLILMPIYCVAGIQEERDKQTLALLFTTQVSAWGILTGKLFSRGVHVAGVVAAGLPMLSLVQLWGGIDMPMIVANFWNTAMLIVSVGALSLLISGRVHKLASALTLTYLVLLAGLTWMYCCCVPVASFNRNTLFLLTSSGAWASGYSELLTVTAVLTFAHATLIVLCLASATILLRRLRDDQPPALDPFAMMRIETPQDLADPDGSQHSDLPPITEPALVWKECHSSRHCLFALSLLFLPFISILVLFVLLFNLQTWMHREAERNAEQFILLKVMLLFTFAWYALSVTGRLAGCIVGERQQRTLDALLCLPIDPQEVIGNKVRGNMARSWHLLVPCGAVLAELLLFDSAHFVPNICFALAVSAQAAFCALLGLYLSVICRTTMSAYVALCLCLTLLFVAMPIVPSIVSLDEDGETLLSAVNPAIAWLTMPHAEEGIRGAGAALLGAVYYVVAATALWTIANHRFARNPARLERSEVS